MKILYSYENQCYVMILALYKFPLFTHKVGGRLLIGPPNGKNIVIREIVQTMDENEIHKPLLADFLEHSSSSSRPRKNK